MESLPFPVGSYQVERVKESHSFHLRCCRAAVKKLPRRPRRPQNSCRLMLQRCRCDVKLLERDAAGVQLVGVQEMLEPLPHLGTWSSTEDVILCHWPPKPTGNCKRGGSPVSGAAGLFLSMIPDREVHCQKSQGWLPRGAYTHQQRVDLEKEAWEMHPSSL